MIDVGGKPAILVAECRRLLAEWGWEGELQSDLSTLSAGAVRSSFLLPATQHSPGTSGRLASAQNKAVIQVSQHDEKSATARSGPLSRIPASVEWRALLAADRANVPVAPVLAAGYSEALDADVLITGWKPGESIPRRILRSLASRPDRGQALAIECGRAMAALHEVEPKAISGLPQFDLERPYLSHIDDLNAALDDLSTAYPALRYGIWWLSVNTPEDFPEPKLVHGDFRLGNLLVDDGRLGAVVDWELAHAGDPMCDLAWMCLRTWRFGHDDLEVGGFGLLDDLRSAYSDAGGSWDARRFAWWTVARTVWWGTGLATQAKTFDDHRQRGLPASLVHAASGRRVVELEYDLLKLIGDLDEL